MVTAAAAAADTEKDVSVQSRKSRNCLAKIISGRHPNKNRAGRRSYYIRP